jgi:hypothetical protein
MKYTFTLKALDIERIHKTYDLNIVSNITNEKQVSSVTKISELSNSTDDKTIYSFIDDSKKDSKIHLTMKDYLNGEYLPQKTNIYCFWCRSAFNTIPIGCPIKYCSSQLEKSYFSEITKDKYIIKENITSEKREFLENKLIGEETKRKEKFNIIEKEYYETDGVFCSFNCCLAFITENKSNSFYKHSQTLLKKIYFDIYKAIPENLSPSPSWRLLKEYGGDLSIYDFRKNLNRIEYVNNGLIKNNLKFKTIGFLYSEKLKI